MHPFITSGRHFRLPSTRSSELQGSCMIPGYPGTRTKREIGMGTHRQQTGEFGCAMAEAALLDSPQCHGEKPHVDRAHVSVSLHVDASWQMSPFFWRASLEKRVGHSVPGCVWLRPIADLFVFKLEDAACSSLLSSGASCAVQAPSSVLTDLKDLSSGLCAKCSRDFPH